MCVCVCVFMYGGGGVAVAANVRAYACAILRSCIGVGVRACVYVCAAGWLHVWLDANLCAIKT